MPWLQKDRSNRFIRFNQVLLLSLIRPLSPTQHKINQFRLRCHLKTWPTQLIKKPWHDTSSSSPCFWLVWLSCRWSEVCCPCLTASPQSFYFLHPEAGPGINITVKNCQTSVQPQHSGEDDDQASSPCYVFRERRWNEMKLITLLFSSDQILKLWSFDIESWPGLLASFINNQIAFQLF